MIIMPSLTALAGRAGDWDRAFISAAKLRGELFCWDCAQKQPQTACRTRGNKLADHCYVNGNITPGREKQSERRMNEIWDRDE